MSPMDLFLLLSLLATFAASVLAEQAAFPAKDTIVVRFLRAFGIYSGLLIMAAYFCTYYIPMALSPTVIFLFAILIAVIPIAFGKRGAQTDYSLGTLLPALAVFAAAFLLFLTPSAPSFFPISYGIDATHHFFFIQNIMGSLLSSQPPMPHIDGIWFSSYGFHLLAALHLLAIGTDPVRTIYPLMVAVMGLIAVAFYAIAYTKTKDNGLSVFAGLIPLVSNFAYQALWGNGTWAQIFAQLIILILVLECIEFLKRRDLAALAAISLCMQTVILAHSFVAIVPLIMMLALLAFRKWRVKLDPAEAAVFALIALIFPIPYFLEYLSFATGTLFVLQLEGGVSRSPIGMVGIPIMLFLAAGLEYVLLCRYDLKDDWALRFFALASAASLVIFSDAALILGFGSYWYYKLWLLAAYPLLIYAILVLDRIIEVASSFTKPLLHSSKGYARFMALSPILVIWLLFPALASNELHKDYHAVLTEDEYAAINWVKSSPGISKISPIADYDASYFWALRLSGKGPGVDQNSTCYFQPLNYSIEASGCAARVIASSDGQTAVFIQNYRAVTGTSVPTKRLVEVGGVCASILFSSGNATVLSKARNTAVSFNGMALTEGDTTYLYPASGCGPSGCRMPMDADQTGTIVYNFTIGETPARLYLKLFETAFNGEGTTHAFISTDGDNWAMLPIEDLRPVAYGTQDITAIAGSSQRLYVRADFEGIEFQRLVQMIGAGGTERAVELVGCR